MDVFFRFIPSSLFRRCLAHRVGPHSPMLHFCREPNLYRGPERTTLTVAGSALPFWWYIPCHYRAAIYGEYAVPSRGPSLPFSLLTHTRLPLGLIYFWFGPHSRLAGAKEWNRTTDLPLMRRTFLPSELLGHM